MGCLCSKNNDEGEVEINFANATNAAVLCKAGSKGKDVHVFESSGFQVRGSGIFLGSCPLDCDTGRWEVVVNKEPANVEIGLMRMTKSPSIDLGKAMRDYNGSTIAPTWTIDNKMLKEGDVVGIYWDQTDIPMVSFTVNGKLISEATVNRIRPSSNIFAAVSVQGKGEVTVVFDESSFKYPPIASKFKMIICSTSLI